MRPVEVPRPANVLTSELQRSNVKRSISRNVLFRFVSEVPCCTVANVSGCALSFVEIKQKLSRCFSISSFHLNVNFDLVRTKPGEKPDVSPCTK